MLPVASPILLLPHTNCPSAYEVRVWILLSFQQISAAALRQEAATLAHPRNQRLHFVLFFSVLHKEIALVCAIYQWEVELPEGKQCGCEEAPYILAICRWPRICCHGWQAGQVHIQGVSITRGRSPGPSRTACCAPSVSQVLVGLV